MNYFEQNLCLIRGKIDQNRPTTTKLSFEPRDDVFVPTVTSGGKKHHYGMLQIYMSCWRFLSLSGAPVLISVHTRKELVLLALRVTQTCLVCRESTHICRRAGWDRAWWIFGGTASAAAHVRSFHPPLQSHGQLVFFSRDNFKQMTGRWAGRGGRIVIGQRRRLTASHRLTGQHSSNPVHRRRPAGGSGPYWSASSASHLKGNVRRQQPSDNQWRSAPSPEAGSGSNRVWEVRRGKFLPLWCWWGRQSVGMHSQSVWPWMFMWQCAASPGCLSGCPAWF